MKPTLHRTSAIAAVGIAAIGFAGCGSKKDDASTATPAAASTPASTPDAGIPTDTKGNLSFVGIWAADEEKSFKAVLAAFEAKYPNIKVKYTSKGDNTPTVLSTDIEGGKTPDLAAVGQPGLVKQFQAKGALKSLDFAKPIISAQYPADIVKLGSIDNSLYSFVFKAANKSTVWYNVKAFTDAGVTAPKTWEDFLANSKTLGASGTPAYSIGGADGWTLTDLFENIYIRQAGADKYDQLTDHTIPWTDPSVTAALTAMAQIFNDKANILGGTSGAEQTDFATSVEKVFVDPAKAAQVIEGDFVPGVVASKTKLKPGTGYNVFPFPSINNSPATVVGGGDSIVMFNDSPASEALVDFLASKDAQEVWAKRGGFSSANKTVDPAVYPDDITRATASAIAAASTFRFDMSDLSPADFGGTAGQGEWKILQDFLAKPSDIEGTQKKLEKAAAKAYKK